MNQLRNLMINQQLVHIIISCTSKSPVLRSTALVDFEPPNIVGGIPDNSLTTTTNNYPSSLLDQTTHELRKAIVGDLIKNPKIF